MDASTFRWVLVAIAILVGVGIYFFGLHQARLRRRSAIDTFTREEIDSAFVEDEMLRSELDNLNQILTENENEDSLDAVQINPAMDVQKTPFALPDPEIFIPPAFVDRNHERVISYHLRHQDFRLVIGEEADKAARQAGLELNADGLLECRQDGELAFQVASLSAPGTFFDVEQLDFVTLGFNCYIDLDICQDPKAGYEVMLRKVDELVRMLDVKVYQPDQSLLTIADVTRVRAELG